MAATNKKNAATDPISPPRGAAPVLTIEEIEGEVGLISVLLGWMVDVEVTAAIEEDDGVAAEDECGPVTIGDVSVVSSVELVLAG